MEVEKKFSRFVVVNLRSKIPFALPIYSVNETGGEFL